MSKKTPKLITIVGETASGKSALALEIAKKFNGEIINGDSRQIYRGMDIGTAKPTAIERTAIPHHLLDIVEVGHPFSAAQFKAAANSAILDISTRGKLPILVGGTGLYIDSILFDFQFLPPNPSLRTMLSRLTSKQLLARINQQGIDITSVDTSNRRRLIRLLETGKVAPKQTKIRPNTLVIGLRINRTQLRKRIEQRIDTMLASGFLDEIRQLGEQYGWESEAMTGIGYRAFKDVILGKKRVSEAKVDFIHGDLNLAKRQRTWFKRNLNIHWIEQHESALGLVHNFLKS